MTFNARKFGLSAITAACLACDHSPVVPEPVPVPVPTTAGSFEIDNPCGTILESASGGIFTFGKASILTLRVDSRNADGTVVWSKLLPTDGPGCAAAVSTAGNLVVATHDSVFSLAQTGAIRWRLSLRFVSGIATSSTGKIFLSHNGYTEILDDGTAVAHLATLYAVSDADGSVLWSQTVDAPGAPFVDDLRSTVYQVRRAGATAMDLSSGAIKWQTPLGSDFTIDAAIASDGTVLVSRTNDYYGEVTAYGTDGTRLWRDEMSPRQPMGSPVIDDQGVVYSAAWISLANGRVYAFSVATGETKWTHDFSRIESEVAVDANRTVYVIAQATADSTDRLYGLRDGAIVSATTAFSPNDPIGLLTIHSNKLLYYVGGHKVAFVPTAGVSPSAAWPTDKHDAKRSGRR
jgi:outer membrane protein assembly factor BamB